MFDPLAGLEGYRTDDAHKEPRDQDARNQLVAREHPVDALFHAFLVGNGFGGDSHMVSLAGLQGTAAWRSSEETVFPIPRSVPIVNFLNQRS